MELLVKREIKTDTSTIGKLLINGFSSYWTLEPTDRGLTSSMSLTEIASKKIQNKTAIPLGRYKVTKYLSPRHGFDVPLVNDVPGYAGVEIHVGNFPQDTDGCLLLGTDHGTNSVLNSKVAIDAFYKKIFSVLDSGESVWITYQ